MPDDATDRDPEDLAVDDEDDHVLPPEDLRYPEFGFEHGSVDDEGGFDLEESMDRERLVEFLEDLAAGLVTHDVAVEGPDGYVTVGVGAGDVEASFEPADDGAGELAVTLRLDAAPMFVADDPDGTKVGARGGKGFVPVEQLTTDREEFRCYGWIDDPTDP